MRSLLGWTEADLTAFAARAGRYYRPFDRRPQRGTGEWRHIDNPTGVLKEVQRRILRQILGVVDLPEGVVGGRQGKSIRDNAAFHSEKAVLATFDIARCFPSIDHHQVYDVFRTHLGCAPRIARVLTQLTTFQGRLPQGAPSSSALANLVLLPCFERLSALAAEHELNLSMWIDDVAFSGERAREALAPAIAIVADAGFSVRNRKVRVMPRHRGEQRLTGVTVNSGLSAGRKRIATVRGEMRRLASKSGEVLDADLRSLRGKIAQIAQLNPAQAEALRRLERRLGLPEHGATADRPASGETRPCNSWARHRRGRDK